jgi:O-antigen ligase
MALRDRSVDLVSVSILTMAAALTGLLAGLDPKFAIGAALAIALALLIFADLAAGVAVFTLLTYFELLPGVSGPALSFTKLAGLILAMSWLARITTRSDAGSLDFIKAHPNIASLLFLFLAWSGLSLFWSESHPEAAQAFYRFVLNAVLFLIVFTAIRKPDDAIHVFAAFVIGAAGAAAYGFTIGGGAEPYGEAARLSSDTQNADELASTLAAALALSIGLFAISDRSPLLRIGAIGAAAFCTYGVFLTVSRAGLIALLVTVGAAVVFGGRWRPRMVLVAGTVAVAMITYFAVYAPPEARERVVSGTEDRGTGRLDIWTVGWRMVEDQPVHGVGAGNFPVSSIHYLLEPGALPRSDFIVDTPKVAHNVYLGVLAELGIVGLILFLGLVLSLIACSVKAAWQFRRNDDWKMELLARAHVAALLGFMASLFFASDEFKKQLWLLLAMGPALLLIAQSGWRDRNGREQR